MRFPAKLIRLIAVFLAFSSFTVAFLTQSLYMIHFFTGDTLYIVSFFKDVFLENGNVSDWSFPGAPYFFPDMALFFPIRAITGSTYFSVLIYALLQVGVTGILVLLLTKSFPLTTNTPTEHRRVLTNRQDIALFILVVLVTFLVIRSYNSNSMFGVDIPHAPYFRILHNAFHFGNLINILIALVAITPLLENKRSDQLWSYFALFTISALATISDALFVVSFTAPSIISMAVYFIFKESSRKALCRINLTSILGVAAGFLLKSILLPDSVLTNYILREASLPLQIRSLIEVVSLSIEHMPLPMVYVFIFYGIIIGWIIKEFKSENKNIEHLYLCCFIIISVISTFSALILNGILVDAVYPVNRYFLNFYWFPILFSWLLADIFHNFRSLLSMRVRNVAFCAILPMLFYTSIPSSRLQTSYYPPMAQCVDEALQEYENLTGAKLKNGLSAIGPAKIISEFSKRDLELFQVKPDLSQHLWLDNSNNYRSRYDFAVTRLLGTQENPDSEILRQINGEPAYQTACNDTERFFMRVLVYGKDKIKTKKFASPGDTYTWKACELPVYENGVVNEGCSVTTRPELSSGIVTFGPYEPLPEGTYRFSIQYSSPAELNRNVGSWDVVLSSHEKAEQLQQGELSGTNRQNLAASGTFSTGNGHLGGRIQVRTKTNGYSPLSIFAITLTKVE